MQKIKDFRKGKKVFLVNASNKAHIEEVTIQKLELNIPSRITDTLIFNKAYITKESCIYPNKIIEGVFHLEDYNVVGFKNNYNNHRCFFTAQAAYRYLKKVKGE